MPHDCHYEELIEFALSRKEQIRAIIYTQTPDRLFSLNFSDATIANVEMTAVDQVFAYLARLHEATGIDVVFAGPIRLLRHDPRTLDPRRSFADQLLEYTDPNPALSIELDRLLESKAISWYTGAGPRNPPLGHKAGLPVGDWPVA